MERLHVNHLRELVHRLRLGQSDRAIAREYHLSRITVRKYRDLAEKAGFLDAAQPLPEAPAMVAALGPVPPFPRVPSSVEPYRSVVEEFLDQGVEMMTIFDRLQKAYDYTGSYSSIRRFVHGLCPATRRVNVRVHTPPGQEAQVDFGGAGFLLDPVSGQVRRASVFVMTLCFSRHQYAELVFDQKTPTWLALHRRAFEYFGGVPAKIVLDNLKAGVLRAALHDPVLGEAYRRFAQHYGCMVSPTRPGTPEHKGKVENGIQFVKRSFLAGQQFVDIREANRALRVWIQERAGTRAHGTTHQPPLLLFETQERQQLLPLPADPFDLTETRRVKAHDDCHVVIDKSYYSVPYRYVPEELDAYVYERVVQVFAGIELVATHPRATKPGEWHTRLDHYPPGKAAFLERTPMVCRELARGIGPATLAVVEQLLAERPLDRLRAVQAILRLRDMVGGVRLEAACRRACFYGDVRYRRIKEILNAALDQQPLPIEEPPTLAVSPFTFARSAAEFFATEASLC